MEIKVLDKAKAKIERSLHGVPHAGIRMQNYVHHYFRLLTHTQILNEEQAKAPIISLINSPAFCTKPIDTRLPF